MTEEINAPWLVRTLGINGFTAIVDVLRDTAIAEYDVKASNFTMQIVTCIIDGVTKYILAEVLFDPLKEVFRVPFMLISDEKYSDDMLDRYNTARELLSIPPNKVNSTFIFPMDESIHNEDS